MAKTHQADPGTASDFKEISLLLKRKLWRRGVDFFVSSRNNQHLWDRPKIKSIKWPNLETKSPALIPGKYSLNKSEGMWNTFWGILKGSRIGCKKDGTTFRSKITEHTHVVVELIIPWNHYQSCCLRLMGCPWLYLWKILEVQIQKL